MKDFLGSVRFKILAAILIVLASFMVMAVYSGGSANIVSQLVSYITVPVQRLSSGIAGNASTFFNRFVNADAIWQENQELRAEVNELREQLVDYERAKHENEQFREFLGVMEDREDLKVETASVIARDPTDWFASFTIDKGTANNVKLLDPVMTADGLVGYVYEVGRTSSKVRTILDIGVDVGAYDSATRDIGIVTGTIQLAEEGLCVMEYLPRESGVAEGHLILTSGGSLFPKDIIIGRVKEVGPNSHGTSLAAVIEPAATVRTVKNVFVITHFEGQGEH